MSSNASRLCMRHDIQQKRDVLYAENKQKRPECAEHTTFSTFRTHEAGSSGGLATQTRRSRTGPYLFSVPALGESTRPDVSG